MRTLDIGKHRQVRIWMGELPDAAYPVMRTLSYSVAAGKAPYNQPRVAAVEAFVPVGGRAHYGLLGGVFRPAPSDALNIELGISSETERRFVDSLAQRTDEVRVGLPNEYVSGVKAGIELAKAELKTLAPGTLVINHAAHGAVGSCTTIYKHVASILVKVLDVGCLDLADGELRALLPETFE